MAKSWADEYLDFESGVDSLDEIERDRDVKYNPEGKKHFKYTQETPKHYTSLNQMGPYGPVPGGVITTYEEEPYSGFDDADTSFSTSADNYIIDNFGYNPQSSGAFSNKKIEGIKEDYNKALASLSAFESSSNLDDEYSRLLSLESKLVDKDRLKDIDAFKWGRQYDLDKYGGYTIEGSSPFYDLGNIETYNLFVNDPRISESDKESYETFQSSYKAFSDYMSEKHPNVTLPAMDIESKDHPNILGFSPVSIEGEDPGLFSRFRDTDLSKLNEILKADPVAREMHDYLSETMGKQKNFISNVQKFMAEDTKEYLDLYGKFTRLRETAGVSKMGEELDEWNKLTEEVQGLQGLLDEAYK